MPKVHLVDATYELFRAFFGAPSSKAPDGREVGATRGVMFTLLYLCREEGATHVACATDHVVRSFRNELYAGYKTELGVPEVDELLARGGGATRRREAHARGGMPEVLRELVEETRA